MVDVGELYHISQVQMLYRTNILAIVGTGHGARYSNNKGTFQGILGQNSITDIIHSKTIID